MTIRDVDKGAKKLLKTVEQEAQVRVGLIGSKASASKKDGEGLTVVEVGTFHEFGLGVPRRSFIADYVDADATEIKKQIDKVAKKILQGKMTVEQALELIGIYTQGGIQERIADRIPPSLDWSTIKRKGSSVPLIDTGQLRSSITYEVDANG